MKPFYFPNAAALPGDDGSPIDDTVVERAIEWHTRLHGAESAAQDQLDFQEWLKANHEHARAFQRIEQMEATMQRTTQMVDSGLALKSIARADEIEKTHHRRRGFLKTLAWVGAGGTILYITQEQVPWQTHLAAALSDVHTATGEQRQLTLDDGTELLLNTATAIDIRYTASARQIILRSGEILVTTAKDAANRPQFVSTRDGALTPVGTRFTVRRDEDGPHAGSTQLAVIEGAVQVRPANLQAEAPTLLQAGEQVRFTRSAIGPTEPTEPEATGWASGSFSAEATPLGQFIEELARYHPGRLRCDPAVAQLRITGVWPLNAPNAAERILQSVAQELPVRINRTLGYWVTVSPR